MGLRPRKIIQLVSRVDLVTRKKIGIWLPDLLKVPYADSRQRSSIHYWSRRLRAKKRDIHDAMAASVAAALNFSKKSLEDALKLYRLEDYCDDVERIMVDDLADPALSVRLEKLSGSQILFTGGGIVPATLLSIPKLRFIHIHPGFLPDIRGADCVLWSSLMKGRTSASCFFMTPGLDDGDVIHACHLPKVSFDIDASTLEADDLYRAVYAFFDPWVRSYALRKAIVSTNCFREVNAVPQPAGSGQTYHFMHEKMRARVCSAFFAASGK
jgi:hypothetical protein